MAKPFDGLEDSRLEVLRLSRNDEGQGLDSAARDLEAPSDLVLRDV